MEWLFCIFNFFVNCCFHSLFKWKYMTTSVHACYSVDKRFQKERIRNLTFSGFCFVMCKTCGKMKEGKYAKTLEGVVEVLKESMECWLGWEEIHSIPIYPHGESINAFFSKLHCIHSCIHTHYSLSQLVIFILHSQKQCLLKQPHF